MADYIILSNSNASLVKRFYAAALRTIGDPSQTVDKTIEGGLDITWGGYYKSHQLVLFVPYQVSDSNYGTKGDLETLHELCNPSATPSTLMIYTDHHGSAHDAYFVGRLVSDPVTATLGDAGSYYLIPVVIQFKP